MSANKLSFYDCSEKSVQQPKCDYYNLGENNISNDLVYNNSLSQKFV